MANNLVNEKTFKLVNRISKSFSLYLSNFAPAATLLFKLKYKISVLISPRFIMKMATIINLRKVKISYGTAKLISSVIQSLSLKKIKIDFFISEQVYNFLSIDQKTILSIVSKAVQKVSSSIVIKKIKLTIDVVVASFFSLGDFDFEILGDLDGLTLGEMDYTS